MGIAIERLEPFRRVAGAVLKLEDFEASLGLIFVEPCLQAEVLAAEHLGELDRIFKRELGARADREMRGVRSVPKKDHVARVPALALDPAEVQPCRGADQVRSVRLQRMAIEIFR